MANTKLHLADFVDAPYFIEYEESLTENPAGGHNDGYSMYRAIARMVIGDPAQYTVIRKAVLLFAMRVRAQEFHTLHHQYMAHEAVFRERLGGKELFACLDCPDHVDPDNDLCWVIATALKIQIKIHGGILLDGTLAPLTLSAGADDMQVITLCTREADPPMAVKYSSLLPDESGKALVNFLNHTRKLINYQSMLSASKQSFRGLKVKQMSWAWKKNRQSDAEYQFTSFNESRGSSRLHDLALGEKLDRMDTFVVVVNDASQMGPALELFHDAVLHASNKKRTVKASSGVKPGRMLPHCAADAEFIKVPTELIDLGNGAKTKQQLANGDVEELCSVLTLAVGTQFSLVVNVLHMLQNATEETVPALERLFTSTIFNKRLLKIWWNLQRDFIVLDNTIAHMYQGSAREPYVRGTGGDAQWVTPRFRLHSPSLHGTRPQSMEFPKGYEYCEIHIPNTNELNMSCPCQLRNVDIAALLSHFARLHGFPRGMKAWTETEFGFNYGHLISTTLGDHRLLPLLQHLKDVAGGDPRDQAAFYQGLGTPRMEADDKAMGYVLMDTYALNIILEKFLAQDDPRKIADALLRYGFQTCAKGIVPMSEPEPQRQSSFGDDGGKFGLFEDNPKRFKRDGFWEEYGTLLVALPYCARTMDHSLTATAALSFWEHEERVNLNRTVARSEVAGQYAAIPDEATWMDRIELRKGLLLQKTMDPLSLWWPTSCAEVLPDPYLSMIIRAGTTHAEALIELLNSSACRRASPPPGFGAALNSVQGLPAKVGRVPGFGLEYAMAIFQAHQQQTGSGHELGLYVPPPRAAPATNSQEPDYEALMHDKITRYNIFWGGNDHPTAVENVRHELSERCAKEDQQNMEFGRPGLFDPDDLYDPEGREYRRRIEWTLPWNRPERIGGLPATEAWKSNNTEMFKALNRVYPFVGTIPIPMQIPQHITEFRPASLSTPRKRAGDHMQVPQHITEFRPASLQSPRKRAGGQQQEEAARQQKTPRKTTKQKSPSK